MAAARARMAIGCACILLLLVGPPAVLSRLEWPLAGTEVTWPLMEMYLRGLTLPPPVAAAGLIAALWGAWGLLVLIVAADVIQLLRGHLPRLGPLRLLAATVAGSGLAAATVGTAAAELPSAPASVRSVEETATASSARPAPAEQTADEPVERTRVLSGFAFDSADLTAEMREGLAPTVDLIDHLGDRTAGITVTGHSDPAGPAEHNHELSERRAEAAAEYLRERLGSDIAISTHGRGATRPRHDAGLGYAGERRVEITYTLAPALAPRADAEPSISSDSEPLPSTQPGPDSQPSSAVFAATGTAIAGLGAGFALGRRGSRIPLGGVSPRRRSSIDSSPGDSAPHEDGDEEAVGTADAPPATHEQAGSTPAAVDAQGQVLLGGRIRDAGSGLSVTGAGADEAVAALLGDACAQAVRVITTRALADHVGLPREAGGHLHIASDTSQALLHAEAGSLSAARRNAESTEPAPLAPALVAVDGFHDPALARRLTEVASGDDALAIVVAGACPDLPSVSIDPRGKPDGGSPVHPSHRFAHQGRTASALGKPTDTPEEHGLGESAAPSDDPDPDPEPPASSPDPASAVGASEADLVRHLHGPPSDAESRPSSAAPPVARRARLRLFAPQVVLEGADGREITSGVRSSTRTLLALLALRRQGATLDEINDVLTDETGTAPSKALRNSATSNARRTVRQAIGDDTVAVIHVTRDRYRLDAGVIDVDLWEFEEHLRESRSGCDQDAKNLRLKTAIGIYEEELLKATDAVWLESERQRYRRMAADICVQLADSHSDEPESIEWLERALACDQYNEALYQEIMRRQALIGRNDAVQRTFQALVERMQEIGASPSPATGRLLEDLTSISPLSRKRGARRATP
jgi:outer membrane protein OmpA-like peptidoglycan-associated protein/DNA-binding SARP family transcriptional activator